jgi:transposase
MPGLERLAARLARAPRETDVRVMRRQVRHLRELTREVDALERELAALVAAQAPRLLEVPGVGVLTAAKLVAEVAGIERFGSPAKLARMAGVAPIPASSGARQRHRLDRGGNRQLNAALHRIAVTQRRYHPPARAYVERRLSEGKTTREALRCLKRQLVRSVYATMMADLGARVGAPSLDIDGMCRDPSRHTCRDLLSSSAAHAA